MKNIIKNIMRNKIHTHPQLEKDLKLSKEHCIVDRDFIDNDLPFLLELSEKMNNQDKRSTSYVYFMVRDKEIEYGEGDYGFDEKERKDDDCLDPEDLCRSCRDVWDRDEDLPEDCSECDNEAFHWFKWVKRIQIEDGVFFTAEACDEYIQRRRYNFNDPHSYGLSNYRSNEMRRVQEIICGLTSENNLLR